MKRSLWTCMGRWPDRTVQREGRRGPSSTKTEHSLSGSLVAWTMPHRVSNWGSLWIPNQASQWRSWWSWMFCAANSMKPRRFLTPGYIGRQLAVRLLLERARSEGQAEGHGNDLDLVRIDHALLGVDVVDAALDVAIDHSEMQGDAGSAVDPEMRAGDRGRRDPLRLGLQVVGAQPRDDIRT